MLQVAGGQEGKNDLFDPRLGSVGEGLVCGTCKLNGAQCPGHTSYIQLHECVFNIAYIGVIEHVLKCICHKCSKLLLPKENKTFINGILSTEGKHRLRKIKELTKNVQICQISDYSCGAQVGQVVFDSKDQTQQYQFVVSYQNDQISKHDENTTQTKKILDANQVYAIFSRISDEDCTLLGFEPTLSRPENMVIKNMLVPTPQIRPQRRADFAGGSKDDPLTQILVEIIKSDDRIRRQYFKMHKSQSQLQQDALTKDQIEDYIQSSVDDKQLLQHNAIVYFDSKSKLLQKNTKNTDAGIC